MRAYPVTPLTFGESLRVEFACLAEFTQFIRRHRRYFTIFLLLYWHSLFAWRARRGMRATYQREMDALESHLAFLASAGSVSPYVGLFGTVWGIMNSFRGLAQVAQATLGTVAPGIAEALIATAMGLFAAIPAVVAYNRFAGDLNRLATKFDSFMEEFSNILQRQG